MRWHDDQFHAELEQLQHNGPWRAEFIADSSGKWSTNMLEFASKQEAERYAQDLAARWSGVRFWRVAPVTGDKP